MNAGDHRAQLEPLEQLLLAATSTRGGSRGVIEFHRCRSDGAQGRLQPAALVPPAEGEPAPGFTFAFHLLDAQGTPSFIWDASAAEEALARAASDYLNSRWPAIAHVTLACDVATRTCELQARTAQSLREERATRLAAATQQKRDRPRSSEPYGAALAAAVADKLEAGASLGYSHRDYCGTGLEWRDGKFRYVELWDGQGEPLQTFASRGEFIAWLAAQSDARLARTDESNDWYWDNQVITRARLSTLVG